MTSLAELTTLRIGGEPRTLITARSESEIIAAVSEADREGRPITVIGGGSNILFRETFAGDVVRIASEGIENDSTVCAGAWVTVQAGHEWDAVVATAVAAGWQGVEALSGIPGTSGATPIQNVGAYGQQVGDTIAQVRVWDRRAGEVRTLFAADCRFGYRSSALKAERDRFVVLSVTFQLPLGTLSEPVQFDELAARLQIERGERAALSDVRAAVLALRAAKGMVLAHDDHDTWSVGSFFLNPVVNDPPPGAPAWQLQDGRWKVSAAWLIEASGFARGFGLNERARLSTKHTLALTNRGAASATDILELAEHVRRGVAERFGVALEFEPHVVD